MSSHLILILVCWVYSSVCVAICILKSALFTEYNSKKILSMSKIYDRRIKRGGQVEYLVDKSTDKWVKQSQLQPGVLAAYDNECITLQRLVAQADASSLPYGYERRVEPSRILGAVTRDGQSYVLVQWQHTDVADLMPYDDIKFRYPQLLIRFMETVMPRKQNTKTSVKRKHKS